MYKVKQIQTDINCVELSKSILKKEPEILKKYPPTGFDGNFNDGNTGLGMNSTTSRFYHYNVLDWEGTDTLKKYIKIGYEEYTGLKDFVIYVKCWVNVMRKGEQIKPHNHCYSNQLPKENHYLCGHLNVQVDGTTSTFYNLNGHIDEMKNIIGNIVFFPSYVTHWTNLYNGDSQRITVAFDIKSKEFFDVDIYPEAKSKWFKLNS